MITKERLYKQIESLPEKIEIEELIDKLLLIEKIENRIGLSEKDETITEKQLDEEVKSWSH